MLYYIGENCSEIAFYNELLQVYFPKYSIYSTFIQLWYFYNYFYNHSKWIIFITCYFDIIFYILNLSNRGSVFHRQNANLEAKLEADDVQWVFAISGEEHGSLFRRLCSQGDGGASNCGAHVRVTARMGRPIVMRTVPHHHPRLLFVLEQNRVTS